MPYAWAEFTAQGDRIKEDPKLGKTKRGIEPYARFDAPFKGTAQCLGQISDLRPGRVQIP